MMKTTVCIYMNKFKLSLQMRTKTLVVAPATLAITNSIHKLSQTLYVQNTKLHDNLIQLAITQICI